MQQSPGVDALVVGSIPGQLQGAILCTQGLWRVDRSKCYAVMETMKNEDLKRGGRPIQM